MNKHFLIRLFITADTKTRAESQLESILNELPEGYTHYVHDVEAAPSNEVAALDNITATPCLVLLDLESACAERLLVGSFEDDQVRRFLQWPPLINTNELLLNL